MSDNNTKSMTENDQAFCAVCKISAKHTCAGCNAVYYCSREHQKSDWKLHSKNCCPFKLVDDPKIGRRYIAKRKIEVDELVLCEKKPLLMIPPIDNFTCLNCSMELTEETFKECDNCGWHICMNCTKHGPECDLTLKYRKSKVLYEEYITRGYSNISAIITVLRGLALRENDPDAYKTFMKLEDHCMEEAKITMRSSSQKGRDYLAKWIKNYMRIEDAEEREIAKILGIFEVNSWSISGPSKYSTVVFDKASYFEHSCCPNCFTTIDKNTGKIVIRAIGTIQKGDPITVCYLESLWGTVERRTHLANTKFFYCSCERCKDPTEFGTMFNAVKCIKNKCTGYMLPPTFLVSDEEKIPDFVCDKCNITTPSKVIDKMMENISAEYSQIDKESVVELNKFIDKYAKVLHENNVKIIDAEYHLTVATIKQLNLKTVSVEHVKKNIMLCKKLSYIFVTLMPAEYFRRGLLLYNMYLSSDALIHKKLPSPKELLSVVQENKKILTEAHRLFRQEPLAEILTEKIPQKLRELNAIEMACLMKK